MLPAGTPTWEGLGELAASINAGSYGAYQDVGVVTVVGGTLVGVGLLEGRIFSEGDTIPNGPVWNPTDAPVFIKTKHPHDPDHWIFEYTVAPSGLIHVGYLARSEPKKTRTNQASRAAVVMLPAGTPTWEGLGELAASINAGSYGAYQDVGVVTVVGGTLVGVGLLEGRIFSEGDTIPNGPVWNPTDAPVFIKTKHPHDPDHWIFEYTVAPNGLIHVGYLARSEPKKTRRDEDKDGSVSLRDGEAPPWCPNTVSVTCVAGYYACGYFQVETSCPRAVCVKNGQPPPTSCIAGGEGTASCSLTIP